MVLFLKNREYLGVPKSHFTAKVGPIGLDMGEDALKIVQLQDNGKGTILVAGDIEKRPDDIKPGSVKWQMWAIEAIKRLTSNNKLRGRDVVAAIPASEVLIEHIKTPKMKDDKDNKLQSAILSKIKQKLPIELDNAMIKYIPTEDDNIMAIVTSREKINRYLAIYEKAQLTIKSICIWPIALTNTYTKFFGRRKTDIDAVVMLVDIEGNCTNVVICRHKNILFAHSLALGVSHAELAETDETITRLIFELSTCRRQFCSMYTNANIERLVFLSGQAVDKSLYTAMAKQLAMPAQMGDCLAAVEIPVNHGGLAIERRGCQFSWATAFGLSVS